MKRAGWASLVAVVVGCSAGAGDVDTGGDDDGATYQTGATGSTTGAGAGTGSGVATTTGGATTGAGAGDPATTTGSGGSDIHTGSGVTTGSGASGSGVTTGSGASTGSGGGGSVNTDCCVPSQSPGCADTTLEACVCALDSYCCNNAWDAICVSEAQQNCSACPNAQCYDIGQGEPNDSEATALNLTGAPITDCDSSGGLVNGTIDTPLDQDWYTYAATDELACIVNPERSLSTTNGGVRLCKYFECHVGPTQVTCPIGTTTDTSPDGRQGCCSNYGFEVDLDCTSTSSDDAWVYIRIDAPGSPANVCTHYAVDYHY